MKIKLKLYYVAPKYHTDIDRGELGDMDVNKIVQSKT